ncbi:MAG: DNA translocase FtsK 4TM domain-containing protein, partial [Xanthomarina sp.]
MSDQQKLVLGSFLIIMGILLFIAFVSFIFTGKADQSTLTEFTSRDVKPENWLNKTGAWISDLFIHRGFGIASFIFAGLIFLSGISVLFNTSLNKLRRSWFWGVLIVIWLSVFFGFFTEYLDVLGGTIGFEINSYLKDYLGIIGTSLLLVFLLITYLAIRFRLTAQTFKNLFHRASKDIKQEFKASEEDISIPIDNDLTAEAEDIKSAFN